MTFTIIGLGNPGDEYTHTRHNTGRIMLQYFLASQNFPEFKLDKKSNSLISKGKVGKQSVTLVAPETFMNKSGDSIKYLVLSSKGNKNAKEIERMMVIYDDLDLPFGTSKMSFNKSSSGHKGLESIIKTIKTQAFPRIRIGIAPTTPSGKIKKPSGDALVDKVILGEYKKEELVQLKKISKKVNEALEIWIKEGREIAMNFFN